MPNCLDDKVWKSKVPGNGSKEQGTFVMDGPNPSGDFVGRFEHPPGRFQNIKGNCSAGTIWFDKPPSGRRFRYSGTFIYENGEKKFIHGSRFRINQIFKKTKSKTRPVADDWTGEKTTTLVSQAGTSTTASTSRKAKASSKKSTKKRGTKART